MKRERGTNENFTIKGYTEYRSTVIFRGKLFFREHPPPRGLNFPYLGKLKISKSGKMHDKMGRSVDKCNVAPILQLLLDKTWEV